MSKFWNYFLSINVIALIFFFVCIFKYQSPPQADNSQFLHFANFKGLFNESNANTSLLNSSSFDNSLNVSSITIISKEQNDLIPVVSNPKWWTELLYALKDQQLLTSNVLSNKELWMTYAVTIEWSVEYNKNNGKQLTALFFMGWVAYWNMERLALNGGLQGEFVIWADLAVGMAAIGYKLTFVSTIYEFWHLIVDEKQDFDVIFTDYDGLGTAEHTGDFPKQHCKYYIIDYFGTQAKYNKRNLNLKHILTPYPYDNSNTAINYVIGTLSKDQWQIRENSAALWAKEYSHIKRKFDLIDTIADILPIHTFFHMIRGEKPKSYDQLIMHGYVNKTEFWKILSKSRVLIGVGQPFDGPTALEAIAYGCVYINPTLTPPKRMPNKPHNRLYTSQHSFVEQYIPPPYAYTIDITNKILLRKTINMILNNSEIRPYIHEYYTPHRYIENIRSIFSNQTQCYMKYYSSTNSSSSSSETMPIKHPNNKVYNNFKEWVADNCGQPIGGDGCSNKVLEMPKIKVDKIKDSGDYSNNNQEKLLQQQKEVDFVLNRKRKKKHKGGGGGRGYDKHCKDC